MTIVKMLDCSTAHVTKKDRDLLEDAADCALWATLPRGVALAYDKFRFGWFLHVPWDDVEDYERGALEIGHSQAFINLLRYARVNECRWILLDVNADPLPFLPTFEW